VAAASSAPPKLVDISRRWQPCARMSYDRGMRIFLLLFLAALIGSAQPRANQRLNACSLLSRAEVDKVTGRKSYVDATPFNGGAGCSFENGQVMIFRGNDAEAQWEMTVKGFGQEKAPRTPIAGLGEKAYAFYPPAKNKYQDTGAFVVVKKGNAIIAVSVNSPEGQSPQSVHPQALELAKLVFSRLQ
jgi:hypothetical protein